MPDQSSLQVGAHRRFPLPDTFEGIGYTRNGSGLPLKTITAPVPQPGPDQLLIHVQWSSLNPLEYKLALLNFLGRQNPVILGFDMAGTVAQVGDNVHDFQIGDEVMAMGDSNLDGGWASGGKGGYALARNFLTAHRPPALSQREAAALPMCFLSAYAGLKPHLNPGDTIYIPGGGGGVGHLAVQMASRALGASIVYSSGGSPASRYLAYASGARHVFDHKVDAIPDQIMGLTGGRGVDLVYDATYSESGFIQSAQVVREGGSWVVLGVGPGKTTRTAETISPVEGILAARGARMINVNLLRYFTEPHTLDDTAKALLRNGMRHAAEWAASGQVVPHVHATVSGHPEAITAHLMNLGAGTGNLGKTAVELQVSAPLKR
jgi:NADPH:quinone reductase-like Zn-dependent oxidoreductase